MSKKKAFVKYAQNKAVAGSLIIRETAPKVGVWKEVLYDLCCQSENQCNPSLYNFTSTLENINDATNNTNISVLVGTEYYTSYDNQVYFSIMDCGGFVIQGGSSSGPINVDFCGLFPLLFYFKNDVPVFIPVTNLNTCTF
jgi:hypothetical protein